MASAFFTLYYERFLVLLNERRALPMFKRYIKNQEKTTMVAVYDELLSSSEDYLMKTIGQALGMSGGSFPDSIEPEAVNAINQGLAYWKDSKSLMLRTAQIMDERHENLVHELAEQRKFLDQQATLLREQTRLLEEISKKKDK